MQNHSFCRMFHKLVISYKFKKKCAVVRPFLENQVFELLTNLKLRDLQQKRLICLRFSYFRKKSLRARMQPHQKLVTCERLVSLIKGNHPIAYFSRISNFHCTFFFVKLKNLNFVKPWFSPMFHNHVVSGLLPELPCTTR